MLIHRARGGKLDTEAKVQASPDKMIGAPIFISAAPYRYADREITAELITDAWKMPIIFSSLQFLSRLCFSTLTPTFVSIDGPEDDTKSDQIAQAAKQFKQLDRNLAQIGWHKSCTTLECLRSAGLGIWSFRQAFFEKIQIKLEGNLYGPRLQHLQGQSFDKAPSSFSDTTRYMQDEILKGVVYDVRTSELYLCQNVDANKEPIEIPIDQVVHIEDFGVPQNTSMLHSIASTIEFAKQARNDFRLAVKRVGTPKEVAEIDGDVLAKMAAQGLTVAGGYQTLVDYCNEMVIKQSSHQAEVALPGTHFKYPNIPVPLNPMEVEKFIEQLILSHFFAKNITEQLAQAVSVSAAPGKALLDAVISGHQEVPLTAFKELWQADFLDVNGYDLVIDFDLSSWTPKDRKDEQDRATALFINGASLVNDYRGTMGEKAYSKEQLQQLFEEQNALKRGQLPSMAGSGEPQE